jgi:hypothetical protein
LGPHCQTNCQTQRASSSHAGADAAAAAVAECYQQSRTGPHSIHPKLLWFARCLKSDACQTLKLSLVLSFKMINN